MFVAVGDFNADDKPAEARQVLSERPNRPPDNNAGNVGSLSSRGDLPAQPQSVGLPRERADFFARRGRWEEAATVLAQVKELDPDDHEVWHWLATISVQTGRLDSYREHCRKSLEVREDARPSRGRTHRSSANWGAN